MPDAESSTAGRVSNGHKDLDSRNERPILVSIGTFLIDAFDTPPLPSIDTEQKSCTLNSIHKPPSPTTLSNRFLAVKNPISPHHTGKGSCPNGTSAHAQAAQNSIERSEASLSSSTSSLSIPSSSQSGTSTPQLEFDDSPPPTNPFEYLGGGGLYALVGARMFLPPSKLKTLVDVAPNHGDLKPELQAQVDVLGKEMWVWSEGEDKKMIRARIRYDGTKRLFQPLVKATHRKMKDLIGSPLQGAEYLHISPPFSAEDVGKLQEEIEQLEHSGAKGAWRPKIVFEPSPFSCHVGQREWLERIVKGIHVLSPNHEELLSFYGCAIPSLADPNFHNSIEQVMKHLIYNIGIDIDGQGILVVRCGREGCCVGTKKGGLKWFPAYWEGEEECRVQDVTGAGNAFLGGYVAGLHITGDPYEAVTYATVAASFVVEQVGMPSMSPRPKTSGSSTNGVDGTVYGVNEVEEEFLEAWNGDSPSARVEKLYDRCRTAGVL